MNNQGGENTEVEYKPDDSPEKKLADFKAEMWTLKKQEELFHSLKAESPSQGHRIEETNHFEIINPDELTLEDGDMWEVVKTNLSGGPVDTLMNIFRGYQKRAESSGNKSRAAFSAFVGNKIGVIVMKAHFR